MNKSLFSIALGLYLLSATAFAQTASGAKCPNLKEGDLQDTWQIRNSAVNCRAQCKTNSDCVSIKDKCGRMIFVNKTFKDETALLASNADYQCKSRLEAVEPMETICERNRCEPAFKSCDVQIKKQNDFLAKNVVTECVVDSDCTFILAPGEKCIQRVPSSRAGDLTRFKLDIGYLRDAVVRSCKMKNLKECSTVEKTYCISKECIVFLEKPPYKNFVNLEGPNYSANYASNTTPLKMPRAPQSKCTKDSDCTETTGICSQYVVSLNKKFLDAFKVDIQKMEKTIACPTTGKVQIPKSRCFKEFCSFVN